MNGDVITGLVDAVERASSALESARADLAGHFEELGRRLVQTGEPQISLELARDLYWDCPAVQVKWIGLALGIPRNRVHEVVGSSRVRTCRECGGTWTDGRLSRTGYGRDSSPLCESCRLAQSKAWEARREIGERERLAEKAARAERLAQGGYWIENGGEVVLPEEPWSRCRGCGTDLRRVDDARAWESGEGVVFVCVSELCDAGGDRQVPTLVRYIPALPLDRG